MRIGIIGCGQLARMMALAGWPMGMSFSFLAGAQEEDVCVQGLGTVVRQNGRVQADSVYEAMGRPAVITVEKEQVDVALLRELQAFCPVYPDPEAVAICQHREREKNFLNDLGIGTAPFRAVGTRAALQEAVKELGLPVFVKSCEQGYDGQNQWRLRETADYEAFMAKRAGIPDCVVEGEVRFQKEVSIIAARNVRGDIALYPLTENHHSEGILLSSITPVADLDQRLAAQARDIAERLLQHWKYVGVLAIECFLTEDGLLVNELAPRVHNSGHWTQEGAATSQFENHLRAIADLPLGDTQNPRPAAMVNLLGTLPEAQSVLAANRHLHLYNKSVKPRRKVGHINLQDENEVALRQQVESLLHTVYGNEVGEG